MPTKCSVSGCENYYSKGVPFFGMPSPLQYKFCSEKAELSKKRRKRWLDAMGVTGDSSEILRICSKHFVTGKPSSLEDSKDVDWVPTLHLKLSSSVYKNDRKREDRQTRKEANRHTRSPKENDAIPRHSKSDYRQSSRKYKPQDKIKKENRRLPKKIDVKKFLNCKVLLNGNIQCTTFKGTNGSGLTIAQRYGQFTSDNVTVKEAAINNTVLRIHLIRQDLNDLKSKYRSLHKRSPNRTRRKDVKVSSFGRKIKNNNFFEDAFIDTLMKKSIVNKTVTARNSLLNIGKTENQMKNQNEKEHKNINKIQSKHEFTKNLSEDPKTLNRAIKRNYRDKIKIKLFPKPSPVIRRGVQNGPEKLPLDKSLQLRREILFVKNFKNESPQWHTLDTTYYLEFLPYRDPEDGTLDYSFQKLVTDVKHMKLPAPTWKIKVIIKQGKISAITFTNKLAQERCVGFSAHSDKYKITIDNKPALLLGSPEHIRTSEDLEILLDIIQNIDSKNPMLSFK